MKHLLILAFTFLLVEILTGCNTPPPDRGEIEKPENTLIVECEMVDEFLLIDTFSTPKNFIKYRYTTGEPPAAHSSFYTAWDGKTYRFETSEETETNINFYYYSASCDLLY